MECLKDIGSATVMAKLKNLRRYLVNNFSNLFVIGIFNITQVLHLIHN